MRNSKLTLLPPLAAATGRYFRYNKYKLTKNLRKYNKKGEK